MNNVETVLVGSRIHTHLTIRQRFDTNWTPEPFSGCHLWTLRWDSIGYGGMSRRGFRRVKPFITAHRVAYALHHGPIPKGMFVLHRCDTKCCVNPDHLFLGTQTDNMRDCIAKGRFTRAVGEKVGIAKLKAAQIPQIRASKEPKQVLAKRYGVSPSVITSVRSRRTWKHIP